MNDRLRVAVADDERDTREFLSEIMPRLGHEVVVSAGTGRALLEGCQRTSPDLVVTDIRMPDMDGIEVAEAVNRGRPTPVILVTAHSEPEYLNRATGEHVMAYLVKPVNEAELRATIGVAMRRFHQFMSLTQEANSLRQALEDRKLIERAKGILTRRLHIDEDDAFRRLRKRASDHNQKLVVVARKLIDSDEIFQVMERL